MAVPSVLLIGSEAHPFAKSGGLADVLGALPTALGRLGWSAIVALPRYRGVMAGTPVERMALSLGGYTHDIVYFDAPMADGARALLIGCPELFDRDTLYGPNNTEYPDNPRRFACWCARRSSTSRADGRRDRPSCTRTTGRPGSRRSI